MQDISILLERRKVTDLLVALDRHSHMDESQRTREKIHDIMKKVYMELMTGYVYIMAMNKTTSYRMYYYSKNKVIPTFCRSGVFRLVHGCPCCPCPRVLKTSATP